MQLKKTSAPRPVRPCAGRHCARTTTKEDERPAPRAPMRRSALRTCVHAHTRMRTERQNGDNIAVNVNRRAALVTAAALALELRNPKAADAAGVTMTISVNTFEGVKGDVGTLFVCM